MKRREGLSITGGAFVWPVSRLVNNPANDPATVSKQNHHSGLEVLGSNLFFSCGNHR